VNNRSKQFKLFIHKGERPFIFFGVLSKFKIRGNERKLALSMLGVEARILNKEAL
jgi:hypothetical protein